MKASLCAAVFALGLVVTSPVCLAKTYTPAQFRTELKLKIGNRQGNAAASAAANLYRTALTDRKNKRYAVVFASAVVSALNRPVKPTLRGRAVNLLTRALLLGYFQGLRFSLNDGLFNRAYDRLLRFLPATQRTASVSQALYNTLKSIAISKGSTRNAVYAYYLTKADRFNIKDPPTS